MLCASATVTLAFISDVLRRVFATMSLALVGYGFADVFTQVVALFASVFTVIPGV